MALSIPQDIPGGPFARAGMLHLDGSVFEGKHRVSTGALLREISYVKGSVIQGKLQSQREWQQVRNIVLLWGFSHRTEADNKALNAFFKHVGLLNLNVSVNVLAEVLGAIQARHDQADSQPSSPANWTYQRQPQRLPSTVPPTLLPNLPPNFQQLHQQPVPPYSPFTHTQLPTPPASAITNTAHAANLNSNPKFQGIYTFTEHEQVYEGYQFQCIFRCLREGKHCRKAPVREMNRHLRLRHHFRPGFRIAGIDWEKKRWRGAGANHEECIGKIVEKDSPDDGEDSDEEEYVVR